MEEDKGRRILSAFVSSTFVDLGDYRKAVCDLVRQIGWVDIAMEHLGAHDERPKDVCLRLVREESDAFVGIYAHRYGHVPSGDSRSITEMEYDEATAAGKKRLIYIIDDNVPWQKGLMDRGKKAKLLDSFKKRLRSDHTCKEFTNRDQLAGLVVADLAREFAFSVYPHAGSRNAVGRNPRSVQEWNDARVSVYRDNRNVFIAHTLRLSKDKGQLYDIAIYLIPHRSNDSRFLREDLSDVVEAEFFLGEHFSNRVFLVKNKGGTLGIVASAYGPFLCSCRVVFSDGAHVMLNRYIDFEMGSQIRATNNGVPPRRGLQRK